MLRPIGSPGARIGARFNARFNARACRAAAALGIAVLASTAALPAAASSADSVRGTGSGGAAQVPPATLSGRLTVDCVVKGEKGAFRAIFGYDNYTKDTATVPVGAANHVTPGRLGGGQPTRFLPGAHRGAFTTDETNAAMITWRVGLYTAVATPGSTACAGPVDLPAEGNGAGPAIVILLSLGVVAFGAYRLHRRHQVTR